MTTLITNIATLVTNAPSLGDGPLGILRGAAIVFDDHVQWVGAIEDAPAADVVIDAGGRAVLPGFVDSHAHLVFAGDRSEEFAARMAGLPYTAGGIRTTVQATRTATDDELRANLHRLSTEMLLGGITHFECKTGYGLTADQELRGLRLAREFTTDTTLLAAHVVPPEFADDADAYVDLIITEMLPSAIGVARWVDVFCDRGAFTLEQTERILEAARGLGFLTRMHANQLAPGGAVDLAIRLGCAAADHCTHLTDAQVDALAASETVATLLPGAEFSTRATYPDARRLLDAGARVAIATDCNPGSSYTTSMGLCIALAVREMRMTADEAVQAATRGGAVALRRPDLGHLAPGARADVLLLDAPSHIHLAYRPGVPLVSDVWQSGIHRVRQGALHRD